MSIINGTAGAHLQPLRFGRNESGEFTEYEWNGTRAELEALIPSIVLSGGTYTYARSFSGGKDQLMARWSLPIGGTAEVPEESWELSASNAEKDLLESPLAEAITDRSLVEALRKFMASGDVNDAPATTTGTSEDKLKKLIIKGQRSVIVSIPTLRHTMTVSNQWAVNVSQMNVGRIISTASMFGLEDIPTSGIQFTLPDLANPSTVSGEPVLKYGWFKNFPSIRKSAWNKVALEQTWTYQLWSTDIYGEML